MNKLKLNMALLFSELMLLFSFYLHAQPGGGGGIKILNYTINTYNYQISHISPVDSNLHLDFYEILDKGKQRKFKPMPFNQYRFDKTNGKLNYIPPYVFSGTDKKILKNQRIDFIYKGSDTATIFFLNVPEENPTGESLTIDTLHMFINQSVKFDVKKYLEQLSILNKKSDDYKKIKSGLTLSNFNLLKELSIVEYIGQQKSLYKVKINKLDTIYYSIYKDPIYVLNYRDINLIDTERNLKSEEIHLYTDNFPELRNGKLHYKFQLVNNDFGASITKKTLDSIGVIRQYLELSFFSKIDTVPFFVNNNLYSGIVKLVIPSYWYDITLKSYPTFDLLVLEFDAGRLIKLNKIEDVGDVNSEQQMSRPSR